MNDFDKTFVLALDTRCNQRCRICMKRDAISSQRSLRRETAEDQIRWAKHHGFKKIDFYGGEPLLYSFTAKAIALANKLSMQCFLATNATRFASKAFARSFFKGIRIDETRTTLHGADPGTHDRITRVPGSFTRTIQGIRNILGLKKTRVSVNIVISALNHTALENMTDLIHGLGVPTITFSGLVFEGELQRHPELLVDMAEIKPFLDRSMEKCVRQGLSARIIKLPVCILRAKFRQKRFCVTEDNSLFMRTRFCVACRYRNFCPGISRHHVRAYGIPDFMNHA